MKKKIVTRISWSVKKPLEMAGIARGTITEMTGNSNFPTPAVDLKDMENAAVRVENAWANRKNGATAKDELTSSCNDLDELLHKQAHYVSDIANGDETIIHSAGFETTGSNDSAARTTVPTTAPAPVLKPENGGIIKAKVLSDENASNYCFMLTIDAPINATIVNDQINIEADTKMYIINSTKSNAVFTGLPGLKKINVVVIISNSNGNSGFSAVATGATLP